MQALDRRVSADEQVTPAESYAWHAAADTGFKGREGRVGFGEGGRRGAGGGGPQRFHTTARERKWEREREKKSANFWAWSGGRSSGGEVPGGGVRSGGSGGGGSGGGGPRPGSGRGRSCGGEVPGGGVRCGGSGGGGSEVGVWEREVLRWGVRRRGCPAQEMKKTNQKI